jgi:hypothetical protein
LADPVIRTVAVRAKTSSRGGAPGGIPGRTPVHAGDLAFWEVFATRHWNREPGHFPAFFSREAIQSTDVMSALVRARAYETTALEPPLQRIYVDGKHDGDRLGLVPRRADRSPARYLSRIRKKVGSGRFGLIQNELQLFDFELWSKTRQMLVGLFARVGIPYGGANLACFFGDYPASPIGLHKDQFSVFTWVLEGRKRFLLWPYETLRHLAPPDASPHTTKGLPHVSYRNHRSSARVIDAEPGDLVYWPPSYWHIAEGNRNGEASLTLTLGLDGTQSMLPFVLSAFQQVVSRDENPITRSHEFPFRSGDHTSRLMSDRLEAFVGAKRWRELRAQVTHGCLLHMSAYGFQRVPRPLPARSLAAHDGIELDAGSRLYWRRNGAVLRLYANGIVSEVPYATGLSGFLRRWQSAGPMAVRDVERKLAAGIPRPLLRQLLERLVAMRCARTKVQARRTNALGPETRSW